jgi:predicted alpha/beta-hydrolase family hydrolase
VSRAPRRLVLAAVVTGALLVAGPRVGRAADDLRSIPSRPGVTQSFLLVRPAEHPTAAVVLFAGGNGALHLGTGRLGLGGNFLVRNRARFAEHGLLVAVVDSPSDRPNGLDGFRTTAAHADDVKAVIAALRADAAVPVWLVGTSMGTVSAASATARLSAGGPDGLVLTSTVTRQGRERPESVGDVRMKDIRVPTLVVHHRDDACRSTPYADTVGLLRDLASAPRRELLTFAGGDAPQSGPCEARAAHGYFGLDAEVVAAIAKWITGAPRP